MAPRTYRRWHPRLDARRVARWLAVQTFVRFALSQWVLPRARAAADRRTRAEEELRRRLGREPTEPELIAEIVALKRSDTGPSR